MLLFALLYNSVFIVALATFKCRWCNIRHLGVLYCLSVNRMLAETWSSFLRSPTLSLFEIRDNSCKAHDTLTGFRYQFLVPACWYQRVWLNAANDRKGAQRMTANNRLGQQGAGRSKKRRDDGTLSRPRICKPLYGPSQGDETGDWTDDGIGLLHVIRLRYSIFIGGQTSTLS